MPHKSLNIVYIPGLGGRFDGFRQWALRLWQTKNRRVSFVTMNWNDPGESYEAKLQRVLETIESQKPDEVVIIGESAGAAMAIVAFARLENTRLITLCGKIGGAKSTGRHYYETVPSFKQLLPKADKVRENLSVKQKSNIINVRALKDTLISEKETTIPGVRQKVIYWIGHTTSILLCLTVFRHILIHSVDELSD